MPRTFSPAGRSSAKMGRSLRRDGIPVGEAGRVVAAHRPVLEQAPALGAVAGGTAHVVNHAEGQAPHDRRVGEVVDGTLDPAAPAPLPVAPVGVAPVAGTDVQRHVTEGLDLDVERLAAPLGQAQRGPLRQAGTGRAGGPPLLPPELLDPAVGPDAGGVVERAVTI